MIKSYVQSISEAKTCQVEMTHNYLIIILCKTELARDKL